MTVESAEALVRDLVQISAPSGYEDLLAAEVERRLSVIGASCHVDRLSQVTATIAQGAIGDASILVVAHLDQVGMVVRDIDDQGFLYIHRLGGLSTRALPGLPVNVHGSVGLVPMVIGVKAHHLATPADLVEPLEMDQIYLDGGFHSRSEVFSSGVRIGDPITYAPTFQSFGGGRVSGTSLDNRLGVATLLLLAERLTGTSGLPGVVHVGFSTQEEFNVRGTLAMALRLKPDVVICVDITPATDVPDVGVHYPICIGGGPVLSRMSFHGRGTLGGLIPHPALAEAVVRSAGKEDVELQYEAIVGLITDAAFLPMASSEGIGTVGIGIPTRYTHGPAEVADVHDLLATVSLLERLIVHELPVDLSRPRVSGI